MYTLIASATLRAYKLVDLLLLSHSLQLHIVADYSLPFDTMHNLLPLISLSALAGAALLPQQPLLKARGEAVINNGNNHPGRPSHSKKLVSSAALEGRIHKQALLKRAKVLSKIADAGIAEYNHPTRVIGSKGELLNARVTPKRSSLLTDAEQGTLGRSTTSTLHSRNSETIMRSPTRHSRPSLATCLSRVWY